MYLFNFLFGKTSTIIMLATGMYAVKNNPRNALKNTRCMTWEASVNIKKMRPAEMNPNMMKIFRLDDSSESFPQKMDEGTEATL